ncbi:hypothetical protein [Phenylobacterium sp.]|uniref:hypothetical protein n=1 Tax=Phenylobacterium sp. TaxID=1871053 RepID=UPI0027308A15|nr:hypothetical protein [Phenylobacterium sp.]MDP1615797.1 hypothetical protein [Phenylobacterium sp.]MDP1986962.1 hypothetical protein [Phenylobacterium sp.]
MSELPVFYLLAIPVAISGLILSAWAWRGVIRVRQLELEIPKMKASSATEAAGPGEAETALYEKSKAPEEFLALQSQIKEFEMHTAETRAAVQAALKDLNMAAAIERSIVQNHDWLSKAGIIAVNWGEPELFEVPISRAGAEVSHPRLQIFQDRDGRYRRVFISADRAPLEVGDSFSSLEAARNAPLPEEWIVSTVDVKASQRG